MSGARITIEGGEAFTAADAGDCLLRAALRQGVGFPHECNVGGCGSCKFDLVEGEVETLWAEAPGLTPRDRQRGKRLACQSRPLGDVRVKVRTGDEYRPRIAPRRRTVRLRGVRPLTGDMSEFRFEDGGPAEFLPGQYALLELPGTPGPRAYSMSNLPNGEGAWDFIVKQAPGGAGSRALFTQLAPGDEVVLDGPYGMAFLRPEAPRDLVLVAGGSGLAPMLSIARAARIDPAASGRTIEFFFGGRTVADLCAERELAALPGFGERLRLHAVVSSGAPDDGWGGARGFVHEVIAGALPRPLAEYEFYFAGPPPMTTAVQRLLVVEHKVPFEQTHFDRYF